VRFLIFPLLCSLVFLSSCDLFKNEQETPVGQLMPLAVGNYWEYETTYLDVIKDTIRYEVTAEVQVHIGDSSYTAYAANFLFPSSGIEPYYWLRRNGEQGLYVMGGVSNTDTLYMNEIEYKFPSEEGETIQAPQVSFSRERLEFYVSDTLHITLIDKDREIVTPAGTFECVVYKFTISHGEDVFLKSDYFIYYSFEVGLVAQIATTENKPEEINEEMYLLNYIVQ